MYSPLKFGSRITLINRLLFVAVGASLVGCSTSGNSMKEVSLSDISYSEPSGAGRLVIGVLDVDDNTTEGLGTMSSSGGDQLVTLAVKSKRFSVIERSRLQSILDEQGLSAKRIFDSPGEMGKLKGVDYLLMGSISGLRVKGKRSSSHFGFFGSMWYYTYRWLYPTLGFALPPIDFRSNDSVVSVECETDLRLVEVHSGEVVAAGNGAFEVTDSLKAIDIEIGGHRGGDPKAELELDDKNKGKVVRFALHAALKDMIGDIDDHRELVAAQAKESGALADSSSQP